MLCTNFKEAEVLNLGAKIFLKSYLSEFCEMKCERISVGLCGFLAKKRHGRLLGFEI